MGRKNAEKTLSKLLTIVKFNFLCWIIMTVMNLSIIICRVGRIKMLFFNFEMIQLIATTSTKPSVDPKDASETPTETSPTFSSLEQRMLKWEIKRSETASKVSESVTPVLMVQQHLSMKILLLVFHGLKSSGDKSAMTHSLLSGEIMTHYS